MVLGREYTAVMDAVAISAAKDLMEIGAPADAVVAVSKIEIGQETVTVSEQNAIQIHRAAATGTGTTVTPNPAEVGSPAFGGTVKVNHTVDTTAGAILYRVGWNFLTPFLLHFQPEEELVISPSGFLVVRLENTPAGATTMSVTVMFREIGG